MKIEGTFPKYKVEFEEKDQYHRGECTAHIDFSKCKDYKPEWQSEAFELIARIFRVDIEKVAHAFGVIYENDIPSIDEDFGRWKLNKFLQSCHDEHRWKPNGITDNIEKWRRKNDQRKAIEQLAEISNKGFTL